MASCFIGGQEFVNSSLEGSWFDILARGGWDDKILHGEWVETIKENGVWNKELTRTTPKWEVE